MRRLVVLMVLTSLLVGCNHATDVPTPILGVSQPSREQLERQIAHLKQQRRLDGEAARKEVGVAAGRERALLDYMGWLSAADPVCRRVPWLCGSQLASQSQAAAAQGWPVRPGLSLLFTSCAVTLWGILGLALCWLGIRFLGPARREVAEAERILEEAAARRVAGEDELAALALRVAALRDVAQATSKEVIAQRRARDALREEVAHLQGRVAEEGAELERLHRERDAML